MLDAFLVPQNTIVTAKGEGEPLDVSSAASRTFLLTLSISKVIEQESLDVSLYTSNDGTTWDAKPVANTGQKFYVGEYPVLADLSQAREAKFVRARWEVNRWGRGTTTPSFEFSVRLREIPAEMLQEAAAEARARQ